MKSLKYQLYYQYFTSGTRIPLEQVALRKMLPWLESQLVTFAERSLVTPTKAYFFERNLFKRGHAYRQIFAYIKFLIYNYLVMISTNQHKVILKQEGDTYFANHHYGYRFNELCDRSINCRRL